MAKLSTLLILLSSLITPLTQAATIKHLHIEDMLMASELIFEGRVTGHRVAKEGPKGAIFTYITFEVLDTVKGSTASDQIELSFLGGTLGNETLDIGHMAYPRVGERGIYFVESSSRSLINPIYGWQQGHYLIKPDIQTRRDMVYTRDGGPVYAVKHKKTPQYRSLGGLSRGVAAGVRTHQDNLVELPMTPEAFKLWLKSTLSQEVER